VPKPAERPRHGSAAVSRLRDQPQQPRWSDGCPNFLATTRTDALLLRLVLRTQPRSGLWATRPRDPPRGDSQALTRSLPRFQFLLPSTARSGKLACSCRNVLKSKCSALLWPVPLSPPRNLPARQACPRTILFPEWKLTRPQRCRIEQTANHAIPCREEGSDRRQAHNPKGSCTSDRRQALSHGGKAGKPNDRLQQE
jgi:hypothetical protein